MLSTVSEAQVYYLFGQRAYNEIGFSLSSGLIRGDWLDNSEPSDIFGLGGFGVGFVHRAHQARGRFGLRSNLSYSLKTHNHNRTGLPTEFVHMTGKSNIIQLGSRVEFNIIDFGPYERRNMVAPFVGGGVNLIYSKNNFNYGDFQQEPPVYQGGSIQPSGFSPTANFAAGIRFKISRTSYLNIEYEFDYLFLDTVDGLNPIKSGLEADNSSDYMHNIGISMLWALF